VQKVKEFSFLFGKWPQNISQNHDQIPFPESFSKYSTFAAKMSEALTEKKEAKATYKKKRNICRATNAPGRNEPTAM
jgi:hypothetical protein